ncbi:D-alanyl-D-alanine carboxypeptidase [Saccharibacter sp. 17.LH.SD]|uniref:D-alanyl-D-alanine carboxypeptidase family protein n=1 Tax=Saccharibacter sp. 17.LH.SD TaxID=2689393 RepID=UPI001371FBFD|nr:D-alanyl-D-alanine carboxypeptidase [Saccharibacter sp. 17.LH.SD]
MRTRRSVIGGIAGITAVSALSGWQLGESALAASRAKAHGHGKGGSPATPAGNTPPETTGGMASTLVGPFATSARWAYILNSTTGTVLLEKDADNQMPPSSLTKMMTAYVVFSFLAAKRIQLDQTFPVSDKAWRMQGSKMFVPLGGNVSVRELIQGMLIQSGNDACIVLAEGIAGSEERFVALMNQAAGRLKLRGSHFANVTGWPDANHYMTARDVGTIADHLIHDFPQYYHFFGEKDFTYNHIHQGNRNVLVDKGLADGLKTGHTDAGGFGLCASSERNGSRVIVVINGTASSNERAHEGERLMSWAFANFETTALLRRGQVIEKDAPVWMGAQKSVPLLVERDVVMTLPIGWQSRVRINVDYAAPLSAPVLVGKEYGRVTIMLADKELYAQPLYAAQPVGQLGLFDRAMRRISNK